MATHPLKGLAQRLLGMPIHALDAEEQHVLDTLQGRSPISRDAADVAGERSACGKRLAGKIAAVGGSWGFILAFMVILGFWMLLNTGLLAHWNFVSHPNPVILLYLVLWMVAALQAPVIKVNQNRQSAKDRVAASLVYQVHLRAKLEVLRLYDKIDEAVAARLDALIAGQAALFAQLTNTRRME